MPTPRCATVLVNPAARGVSERFDGSRIVRYLAKRHIEARLTVPSSPHEAQREAQQSAARGDDLLFVVGGDGSMRDAALGLAGSQTALAAVPAGTVNVWAKEAGIPHGIRTAIDAHIGGQSVHIDLGRADGHAFLLMAGIGWDAEVARRVPGWLKRRVGDVAYIAQAAWMLPRLRPRHARWSAGGTEMDEPLALMVLGNTRLYGGRIHLTPNAAVDDGQLDLIALCPRTLLEGARITAKLAAASFRDDARVLEARAAEIAVKTAGLAVQLDGDFVGHTPMTFTADPGALLVSIPAGPLAEIFTRPHLDRRTT
ncbi:MAG: diacylglycerol/lipid kinase family protein [Tepidiformaceae bacterium]